jgi:hypothetical protein
VAEVSDVIAIVDHPDSRHGRLMQASAQSEGGSPAIRWIPPSLDLPETLAALEGVGAVAIPLGVRGATPRDRFTGRLMGAIRTLMQRDIPVFVAAGNQRANVLAQAGISVSVAMCPGSAGTSEACVRAAIQAVRRRTGRASVPQPR